MGYYRRDIKLSTTPVRDNAKLLKIIRTRAEEWLSEFNAQGGLETFVEQYLEERFERIVCAATGLDTRHQNLEVLHDSPLRRLLDEAIQKTAKVLLKKMSLSIELREKDIVVLQKHAKEEYMSALYRRIGTLAEKKAEKDSEAVFSDLVETTLEQATIKRRRNKTTGKVVRVVKLKAQDDTTAGKTRS